MTCVVRIARPKDIDALYEMAKLTGGGFTNLPADKGTLVAKLARSEDAFGFVHPVGQLPAAAVALLGRRDDLEQPDVGA